MAPASAITALMNSTGPESLVSAPATPAASPPISAAAQARCGSAPYSRARLRHANATASSAASEVRRGVLAAREDPPGELVAAREQLPQLARHRRRAAGCALRWLAARQREVDHDQQRERGDRYSAAVTSRRAVTAPGSIDERGRRHARADRDHAADVRAEPAPADDDEQRQAAAAVEQRAPRPSARPVVTAARPDEQDDRQDRLELVGDAVEARSGGDARPQRGQRQQRPAEREIDRVGARQTKAGSSGARAHGSSRSVSAASATDTPAIRKTSPMRVAGSTAPRSSTADGHHSSAERGHTQRRAAPRRGRRATSRAAGR